ncbi:hypothetical protein Leryth_003645 [Lithospermum erythrorhizon]|nr:hypothetical protein Leryth_003645 [Lithospermum erythrorhizon]
MEWSRRLALFTYPCPCGDLFGITKRISKPEKRLRVSKAFSLHNCYY